MCGIVGIYQNKKNKNKEKLRQAVGGMNASQKSRGPDDEGIFVDEKNSLAFGHRRLSILDLSKAGRQPMGRDAVRITFNGEIYNFLELKKDLEKKGYKFKTKTDTEVILALYAEYGEKSFAMLRGMFAFGLWDEKNKKLFLVKDRYGIKPLYYYSDGEKLIFASTVKAVIESSLIPVEKNPDAYIGFLLFGSVPLPMTTIKNVLALPAGHYLLRGADDSQKIIKYYDPLEPFFKKSSGDFEETVSRTRKLLEDSVNAHLISDAPLGVFLSGGLDSSAIAALAAKNREKPITTFSIIFDEPEFSEEYYSDLVSQRINSDHRKIKITKRDFENSFDEIFSAMDQPTIDGVNTFFIAQAVKKAGLKTVLSGLGADEIFLGYPHFRRAELLREIQKLPQFLKSPLKLGSLFGDRYSKLSYFIQEDILSFYLGIRGLFSPQETAKILDIDLSEVENFIDKFSDGVSAVCRAECLGGAASLVSERSGESPRREAKGGARRWSERTPGSGRQIAETLHPVDLLSYLELKFYLQNQLLKDTDFMSMYHSVEVRVPFLDYKLVEYMSSLSPELKIGKDINKPLLVESVHNLLPPEIFTRPKMGFTLPFQKWMKEKGDFKSGHWSRFWAKKVLSKFK